MENFVLSPVTIMDFLQTDKKMNTWTGINSIALIKSFADSILLYYPEQRYTNKLGLLERVVLFFIKLKTGLSFSCIAILFNVSVPTASKYFYDLVLPLKKSLNHAVFWPTRQEIACNIPHHFSPDFENTRIVYDCTEIAINAFHCTKCRTDTFSFYKGKFTAKFGIGVSPCGLITSVSKAYPGRASDKFIFENENIIGMCESFEDGIMVDKGFLVDELAKQHAIKVYRPPFLKDKKQLTAEEADYNYRVAKARIHIERANQRIKIFNIFNTNMDHNILNVVEEVMFIICAVVNLSPPIIGDQHFEY